VWQSALGCLLHMTTHAGCWVPASASQLPPAAAAALLDACVTFGWAPELHASLAEMAVGLLYARQPHHGAQQLHEQQATRPQPAAAAGGGGGGAVGVGGGSRRGSSSSSGSSPRAEQRAAAPSTGPHDVWVSLAAAPDAGAGALDEAQLAAFGGAPRLLRHFCHASSVQAQRALLVPLLQCVTPAGADTAPRLELLRVLCASPDCLAALQTALSAGVPGWARAAAAAVQAQVGAEGVDGALLSEVLAQLEALALQQAAGSGARDARSSSHSAAQQRQQHAAQQPGLALPPGVEVAMQVTLQQLRGQLPCQQHTRPGPAGTSAEETVFQVRAAAACLRACALTWLRAARVARLTPTRCAAPLRPLPRLCLCRWSQLPPEAPGCWRALLALCWCDDALARSAARVWLAQLLGATLDQSLQVCACGCMPACCARWWRAPTVALPVADAVRHPPCCGAHTHAHARTHTHARRARSCCRCRACSSAATGTRAWAALLLHPWPPRASR
jgi:hypothetical protein